MDATTKQPETKSRRRQLRGVVVKRSGIKTISVEIVRSIQHPMYRKKIMRTKRYLVHDPEEKVAIGDMVTIVETRPMSARKRWALVSKSSEISKASESSSGLAGTAG